jgi:ParB family chromosome partitioning protein
MQDSSAFQYLAIDTIHESTTNPRLTFEQNKLEELAESIRQHGLIQPITVRPNSDGFEIVAGARRFRAAQLAELFSLPARIVELSDAAAMEWQLVENSQRVDVHPYEEAQGFQRLLDIPGYDVAALVEKSGKSASHVYARLSLLQLIPTVAEAFTQERITASHANLIARLPQESQAEAFEQCWRKDWQDKEPHLLPAKHLAAWIQANLYLSVADAPFDREDPTINPTAGACVTCPAEVDTTHPYSVTFRVTSASMQAAITRRLRRFLTVRLRPIPTLSRSRMAGVIPRNSAPEPFSAATSERSRSWPTIQTLNPRCRALPPSLPSSSTASVSAPN